MADPYESTHTGAVVDAAVTDITALVGAGTAKNLTTAGNVILGTAGKGIDFSATADSTAGTMTSELLDDYEEGTWAPVLSDGTNVNATSVNYGFYTKVGDLVTFNCYLTTSSLGSVSGSLRVNGLPFAAKNVSGANNSIDVGFGTGLAITAGGNVGGYVELNTAFIYLHLWDAVTGTTALQSGEFSADGSLMISGSYRV